MVEGSLLIEKRTFRPEAFQREVVMVWKQGDRLTRPLVRKHGSLVPVSWNEALDQTAQYFRKVIKEKGPGAFGMFSCSKATNELNFVAQKFARTVIGTNNIDSCNRT